MAGPRLPALAEAAAPTRPRALQRLRATAVRQRRVLQALGDCASWIVALAFAAWLRFDFVVTDIPLAGLATMAPLAAGGQVVAGILAGLYVGRWRFGSFDEVAALARAAAVTGLLLFFADVASPTRPLPRAAVVGGAVGALLLMGGSRYVGRAMLDHRRRPTGDTAERVVVFGAGEAGEQILRSMLRDPSSPYVPVALLDDDPDKAHLRLLGVPVVGGRAGMAKARAAYDASLLLIAIPSAGGEVVRDLAGLAERAGLTTRVLPTTTELFGDVTVGDIRPITEVDLLGRHQVETDVASIAGYLTAKRVLVTGAGGSIGSELCRQIDRFAPAELIMLDHDESALHAVQLSLYGRAMLDTKDVVLADIRDSDRIARIFGERRPEVVFHAAALKHLPVLEQYPGEGVKTNVLGTLGVLEAAKAAGVERFVNVSTDKAADPASVLGYTKRIAERLTAHVAQETDGTYLSVRFGNVLGSRGSVLVAFREQIAAGGPVTVTHPDVTRYFMTIEEACELVVQAGAIGRDGEALVLDMGEPVRIADVAERLAAQAPRPVEVVYTGLRAGEKLHEVLLGVDEPDDRPVHPLISHVDVPPLDSVPVLELDPWKQPDVLAKELSVLAASFRAGVDQP